MTTTRISESSAAPAVTAPGRIKVGLITPGWGSSGFYSPTVLENAAADKVWPAGTHVFFDHPSESELYDRPERSVRDLAAVTTEDAHWDGAGLTAEADVIGPYRDLVTDPVFVEAVGMSIRSTAETTTGEAEGRKGTIITRLVEGLSVDLVTRAGRGGRVLAVLESARADAREALTDETRTLLGLALGAGCWVIDFDTEASTVVYSRSWEDENGAWSEETLQDTFTVTDGAAQLGGSPVQVRRQTSYVPVDPAAVAERATKNVPASGRTTPPTPNVQEDSMGTIQVDEAEHGRLTEAAGRVTALENERDHATERADTAEAALAAYKVRENARPAIVAHVAAATDIPASRQRRIVEAVVATVTADTTPEQVKAAAEAAVSDTREEIAELREAIGVGNVRGYGAPAVTESSYSEEDFRKEFGLDNVKGF